MPCFVITSKSTKDVSSSSSAAWVVVVWRATAAADISILRGIQERLTSFIGEFFLSKLIDFFFGLFSQMAFIQQSADFFGEMNPWNIEDNRNKGKESESCNLHNGHRTYHILMEETFKLKLLCSVEKEITEEDDFGSELRKCNPSLQKILVIFNLLVCHREP